MHIKLRNGLSHIVWCFVQRKYNHLDGHDNILFSVGAFACLSKCRSYGAQSAFICVSPGFHIGLRPHFTLGFAGVSPFQGSLSDCLLFPQGFISGFALISPWAMQEYRPFRALCRIGRLRCCVVVLCSLNVFGCVNGLLRSCFCLIVIVWFVVLGGGLIDAVG